MSSTRPSTKGNAPTMDSALHLTARERLLVAQAVYEYGSNAWPDISRVLSKHPLISRPKGFFSPQECQKIYGYLMGEAGYECSDETHAPHAQLHLKLSQKHYQARVIELRRLLLEEEEKFKTLTRQIDDIREGRWDEAIAKELGIHPEAGSTKPDDVPLAETANEAIPEQLEHVIPSVPSVPEEEFMDISEEPMTSMTNTGEEQEEVATLTPQLPAETPLTPTVDISEKECPTIDKIPPSPSQVEDVGSALEEIKLSASPDESDVQDATPVAPSEKTLTLVSREERTQEELKAIEALEELSRLEPIDVTVPVQDTQPNKKVDDAADQIDAQTPQDYKDATLLHDDVIPTPVKEPLEPQLSSTDFPPPVSVVSSTVLPGKRKFSDVDIASPDPNRDRKKIRDESVPTDDETVLGRRRPKSSVDTSIPSIKRFQTVITMLHSQISQHRNGNIFHNPIRQSEAPDYHEIVKRPMDLKTIKTRIKDGAITNSDDYQREIYLMFANAMMYNRPKSDIARMAREMLNESEGHIRDFRQTEGFMSRGKR